MSARAVISSLVGGFTAPAWLMIGLHGFSMHPGYWSCFFITSAVESVAGAILWLLPTYLQEADA